MRLSMDVLLDYNLPEPCDVLLQLEAAAMADQWIVSSDFNVTSAERLRAVTGDDALGQRTWAAGSGHFVAHYVATIEIDRPTVAIEGLAAPVLRDLPGMVFPYLLPSRYCESDRFETFVHRNFGRYAGGAKIAAMRDWINSEVDYVCGSSDGTTTAGDTFVKRQGVCRDFAHLMATLSRAAFIPARLVSVYSPTVTPPDFHAIVEVWLEDSWHIVDATGMTDAQHVARITAGRDATDIAFMTVFGSADFNDQRVSVIEEPAGSSKGWSPDNSTPQGEQP